MRKLFTVIIAAGCAFACLCAAAQQAEPSRLFKAPAHPLRLLSDASVLSATQSGSRVVAVGQRGVVLVSENAGKDFRQAKSVPVGATLTSVAFSSRNEVWAAGHWGTILKSSDAGETWQLQRIDTINDQPLFSIWFENPQHGLAVGLFSLVLETHDGGRSWDRVALPKSADGDRSELNLFKVFGDAAGTIYIAAEQGTLYRRPPGQARWDVVSTGGKGTLWTGVALDGQTVVVAGLQGKMFRSEDGGMSWQPVPSNTTSSITDLIQLPDGRLVGTGSDGIVLVSSDRGRTFHSSRPVAVTALHAVAVGARGRPLVFAQHGVGQLLSDDK